MADVEEPEEGEEGSAYNRRNARLRQRLSRWLAASPYWRSYPKELVRVLCEVDDAACTAYDAYSADPTNPVLIKAYVAICHQREVTLKLLAAESAEE